MAKKGCGCGSKKKNRMASFSPITYIIRNAAGELVNEFGNRAQAARELNRHPGYTLHPVDTTQSA